MPCRTETDAAKASVSEEGLSGDVTSRLMEDLMATSPSPHGRRNDSLRAGAIELHRRRLARSDPSHSTLTSPRGVRKVETFRFIAKHLAVPRTCRAAPRCW